MNRSIYRSTPFAHILEIEESSLETVIENSFLKKIKACIRENIQNENFGVLDLANAVHISVSQLNRKLNQLINCTAGKLIRMIRMKFAATLLKDQSMRIGEVAFLTGFKDQAHFCRNFKQEYGLTPTEFQRNKLGKRYHLSDFF